MVTGIGKLPPSLETNWLTNGPGPSLELFAPKTSTPTSLSSEMTERAERESAQLSVEVVASAKQANQKHLLIARREELDETWNSIRKSVSSPDLDGRSNILKSLLSEAKKSGKGMLLRPVATDRKDCLLYTSPSPRDRG